MKEDLRNAIYTEIAKGLQLLQARPEIIAMAETSRDTNKICDVFESCKAPIGYLAAIGSYLDDQPDEETLKQLVDMNRLVGEIVAGAQTPHEVLEKLRGDKRISFRVRARGAGE
jgi:hypothetical protein